MDFEEEWKRKRIEQLMKVARPKKVVVLTSPTCPYCPRAVMLARKMAARGLAEAKEVSIATTEGRKLAVRHGIQGVPTILIDGKVAFVGVPSEAEFERKLKGG